MAIAWDHVSPDSLDRVFLKFPLCKPDAFYHFNKIDRDTVFRHLAVMFFDHTN